MRTQDQFDVAVSSLYETVLDPSHWGCAMRELSLLFGAPRVAMFDDNQATQTLTNVRTHGHDPEAGRLYADYYHHLDPGRRVAMAARVGEWLADEQLLDVRSKRDQEFVHDFALRSDLGYMGGCKIAGGAESWTYLSLSRPPDAVRFGEDGHQLYLALEPHLARINRMQAKIDALSAKQTLAHAALDRLMTAVVVVDRSRCVRLLNAHGFQMLSVGGAMSIKQRRLSCRQPWLDARLGRLVALACDIHPQGGALRVPCANSGLDWMVMTTPVPATHEFATAVSVPLAMVVIADPAAEHVPMDVYQAMFSLTRAEALLLNAVVHGTSVSEWSAQRGVSVATVRTQLHSLFEKTGTDSQGRLISLVRALPPVG